MLTITGSAETSTNPPTVMDGWYYTPAQLFAELASQGLKRFTGGLTYNWRPMTWLTTRATVGYDIANRNDIQFFPTGRVAPQDQNNDGIRADNRFQISQTSVDLAATARFKFSESVGSKTSFGGQWFRDYSTGTLVTGRGLVPGSETIAGAASVEASSNTTESRSVGTYLEEEVALKERLFLTGARSVRRQQRLRKELQRHGVSQGQRLVAAVRGAVLHKGFFNTLRLRGAFGASGQQPGTTDALRFFSPVTGKKNGQGLFGVTPAVWATRTSSRSDRTELELGFDAAMSTTGSRWSSPTTTRPPRTP